MAPVLIPEIIMAPLVDIEAPCRADSRILALSVTVRHPCLASAAHPTTALSNRYFRSHTTALLDVLVNGEDGEIHTDDHATDYHGEEDQQNRLEGCREPL